MRVCFSRNFDKYNFKNNDRFIQIRVTLYFNATILFVFETIEFEIFKFTHARENLSRQFSISILATFLFSILENLFNFLQFSNIVKNILSFVELTIESYQIFRKLRTNEDFYFEKVLIWKNHKSYFFSNLEILNRVFVFDFLSLHDHLFEKTSNCYL